MKTIQLGIRVNKKIVDDLDNIAKWLKTERNMLIKNLIGDGVTDLKKTIRMEASEDYITLKISREQFIEMTEEKPDEELEYERKEFVKAIKNLKTKK